MTLIFLLVKASLLMSAAAAAHEVLGRRLSAASRHLLWTFAIAGLLLLPVLSFLLPGWTAVRLTAPDTPIAMAPAESRDAAALVEPISSASHSSVVQANAAGTGRARFELRWSVVLGALYALGVAMLLGRLGAQRLSIARLIRRATVVRDPEWTALLLECARQVGVRHRVRLVRCLEQPMPAAFGLRRGTILIPALADTWSDDRRRCVLLHELAHLRRYDCLTQALAAVACALYWVHPGVWWMARRLRVERELACDDRVLSAGPSARDYAADLLEIAYALRGDVASALAVNMAGSRQLEGRLLAVLDSTRNRAVPGIESTLAGVAIMAALLVPIATGATTVVRASAVESTAPVTLADRDAARAAAPGSAQARLARTWEVRPTEQAGRVHLRLSDDDGHYGSTIDVDQLDGLPPGLLTGAGGAVRFSLRRDAGTFTFEGVVRDRVGAGTYIFAPSATFAAELTKRGFERPTPDQQRVLALHSVELAFLDELIAQGYSRPGVAQVIRSAEHGVSLSYVREMGELGYRLGRIEALVEQRDHGVTPQFIRALAAQGIARLSAGDLIRARDHGVSAEYIGRMSALGYRGLDLEALITLRDHGVSPEFIGELNRLGFRNLSSEALTEARNHGISPEYIADLRALGYTLTLEELRRARDHGVNAEELREMSVLGYRDLSLDSVIRLRNHGVSATYVRALSGLGYGRLSIEDLVGLRNHGVTPERIQRANARAGSRLSVERLKALAASGWR